MRGRQTTCCFTGHRPSKLPWKDDESDPRCLALKRRIANAVEAACEEGIEHFICGMAEGCDLYFCEAVLAAKENYPNVTVEAAIPCSSQSGAWRAAQRERYDRLRAACDFETLVQEHYTPDCMQRRNRYMVDHSCMLIAAHDGLPGGTRNTIAYAMRRGLFIIDLPIWEG